MYLLIKAIFFFSVTAFIAVTDVRERIIPNKIILPGILIAFIMQIFEKNYDNLALAIVLSIVMIIIYAINSNILCGGDIKAIVFYSLIIDITEFWGVMTCTFAFSALMLIYYFFKQTKTKIKQTLPLALSLFVGTILNYLIKLI